jgi:hypothetical protein
MSIFNAQEKARLPLGSHAGGESTDLTANYYTTFRERKSTGFYYSNDKLILKHHPYGKEYQKNPLS